MLLSDVNKPAQGFTFSLLSAVIKMLASSLGIVPYNFKPKHSKEELKEAEKTGMTNEWQTEDLSNITSYGHVLGSICLLCESVLKHRTYEYQHSFML